MTEKLKAYISGELKSQLSAVSRFTGGRSAIPASQSLLIKGNRHTGLNVSATNLVVGIRAAIPAQVSSEGTVLIPPNLVDLVAGAQKVTLSQDGAYDLGVQTEAYKGKLKGLPTEEYPEEPPVEKELFSLPTSVFKEVLAVADFSGKNLDFIKISWRPLEDGKLRMTAMASDGFIAGVYSVDLAGEVEKGDVIFPAPSTRVFETLISLSDSQTININKGTGKLMATDGQTVAWVCLAEKTFPEVEKIFTQLKSPKGDGILRLDEVEFGAGKMLALMANDKTSAGIMQFGDEEVLLMSQETSLGSGQFNVPFVESSLAEDMPIAVSFDLVRRVASNLLGMAESKDQGNARVAVFSDRQPILFKMPTAGKGRIAAVVMPMSKEQVQKAPAEESDPSVEDEEASDE